MELNDTDAKQFESTPHRRLNILTGEWVLVSAHRSNRPWNGQLETQQNEQLNAYQEDCYLCPGNARVSGERNPDYQGAYIFDNDHSALLKTDQPFSQTIDGLLQAKSESGCCKVICFSPRHDLTLAEMAITDIKKVVDLWKSEYAELSKLSHINHVQIFENKGAVMGCSNPHPHGQIWAQQSIPVEPKAELQRMKAVLPKPQKHCSSLLDFSDDQAQAFASILKNITVKYDNLFNTSFPYSAGIHQAPVDGGEYPECTFHMHFYPPLLRSAQIKKFMVGYEMLAESQRDITPEKAAQILRDTKNDHYRESGLV